MPSLQAVRAHSVSDHGDEIWSTGRVTCPITSINKFDSLDRSQRTRMNGIWHVGSKKNKDQLKQYFNASDQMYFIRQRKINVTSIPDMK